MKNQLKEKKSSLSSLTPLGEGNPLPKKKREIPTDGTHITYQLQYRTCGKASCSTCRNGQGHGPYWYGYWREGRRSRSGYVGKTLPPLQSEAPERRRL